MVAPIHHMGTAAASPEFGQLRNSSISPCAREDRQGRDYWDGDSARLQILDAKLHAVLWTEKNYGSENKQAQIFLRPRVLSVHWFFWGKERGVSDLPNLGFGSLNLGESQKHGTTKRPPFSVENKRHPIPPPRTQTLKTTFLTIVDCFPDIFCSQCERFGWKGSTLLGLWYPPAYFCGV